MGLTEVIGTVGEGRSHLLAGGSFQEVVGLTTNAVLGRAPDQTVCVGEKFLAGHCGAFGVVDVVRRSADGANSLSIVTHAVFG